MVNNQSFFIRFTFLLLLLLISSQVHAKRAPLLTVDKKNATKKLFVKVDGCQPALGWQEFRINEKKDFTYDVAVFTAIKGHQGAYTKGEQIAYSESLNATSFKITPALLPKTEYFWSIRLRSPDNKVGNWYVYDPTKVSILGYITVYKNMWFGFKTPNQCL